MNRFYKSKRAAIEIPTDEASVRMWLPLTPDLRFPGALLYNPKQALVVGGIDLAIHMDPRVGIVGLNRSGKSTLIKSIAGTTRQTKGTVNRHPCP
ncbi:hypothetical protein HD806DRAFT_527496 [Xylariaceae sp. AK1471]|nr:hypothetical protein HD806DRAFT_527496 [Xylariaceae sp. AK1471]